MRGKTHFLLISIFHCHKAQKDATQSTFMIPYIAQAQAFIVQVPDSDLESSIDKEHLLKAMRKANPGLKPQGLTMLLREVPVTGGTKANPMRRLLDVLNHLSEKGRPGLEYVAAIAQEYAHSPDVEQPAPEQGPALNDAYLGDPEYRADPEKKFEKGMWCTTLDAVYFLGIGLVGVKTYILRDELKAQQHNKDFRIPYESMVSFLVTEHQKTKNARVNVYDALHRMGHSKIEIQELLEK